MRLHRLWPVLLYCCLAPAAAPASAQSPATGPPSRAARGLIVHLKAPSDIRESAQATRERLTALAADTGLSPAHPPIILGGGQHLLRFAHPLSGADLQAVERRVRLHPFVATAEPDLRLKRLAEPQDPYYVNGTQWYLRRPAEGGAAAINLPPAWDRSAGSPRQVVAVLDSGVLYHHPDLAGRLLPGYDMVSDTNTANDGDGRDADASDPGDWINAAEAGTMHFADCTLEDSSWHGTFIAGVIAATTNNGQGVAGVSWNSMVLPVRVAGKCGAWLSDLLDGMRWAAGLPVAGVPANPYPAKVINISYGGNRACSSAYQLAIDDVTAAGALVVAAAGNNDSQLTRPADCAQVLSVGAVRQDGLKTAYSNHSPALGIMAPGGPGATETGPGITATSNTGKTGPGEHSYATRAGTSFATPLAAGVASLMLSLNPALTPAQLIARIQAGARPFPANPAYGLCPDETLGIGACNCTTASCGPGLLDADRALQQAASPSAVIAPLGDVAAGGTLTLDGRGSAALPGRTIAAYQWSLVSGPAAVSVPSTNAATVNVSLPSAVGTWVFRLLVTDSAGDAADNYVTASTTPPPEVGARSSSSSSGGGGALGPLWGAGLWLLALVAWARRRP